MLPQKSFKLPNKINCRKKSITCHWKRRKFIKEITACKKEKREISLGGQR
jgi:hypothetical protein